MRSAGQTMEEVTDRSAAWLRGSVSLRRVIGCGWHIVGIGLTFYVAFLLRFDFSLKLPAPFGAVFASTLPVAVGVHLVVILAFGLYRGLWTYFSFADCIKNVVAFGVGTLGFMGVVYVSRDFSFEQFPRSIFVSHYLLLLSWEIGGRVLVRLVKERRLNRAATAGHLERVIVVGDTMESDQLIRSLKRRAPEIGQIVGIVTEERHRRHATLQGIPVVGMLEEVGKVAARLSADKILILPPFTAPNTIKRIVQLAADENVSPQFRVVPSLADIARGDLDVSAIRRVEIEDLLNRKPNRFEPETLRRFLAGKNVMVTGAGGSIGSEICRQVIRYRPAKLVLFELSEFGLYDVEGELVGPARAEGVELLVVAGDVRSGSDVRAAVRGAGGIDVLYHAAAYKHVPLMEKNVAACFLNNVIGSHRTAEAAEAEGVGQFVLISSDKAVRPTSVMGASKRIAERFLLERAKGRTEFKAVRFGNVLGSSGSVVPLFRKQIEAGGPVTVTSPEVTRFFMTIPEAVELVLMAGAVGDDRNIMVLEMGEAVQIAKLAKQMIELSGFVPGRDIEITYTGLRPGEKEYEELLTDDENVARTAYEKIWVVAKNVDALMEPLDIGEVERLVVEGDVAGLRELARRVIPGQQLG